MQTLAKWAGRVALSLARTAETRRVLDGLHEAGVPALLVKGAHVEWTCYAHPHQRERSDTDLLVRDSDVAAVGAVLTSAGYEPAVQPGGRVAVTQRTWLRTDAAGVDHAIDLHWRLSNVQIFRSCLDWDELWSSRVSIPPLGPHAYGPSLEPALILACIHRLAHHARSPRQVWLDDIDLLCGLLDEKQWSTLTALACSRGLGGAVAVSLHDASAACGTTVPARVLRDLQAPGATSLEVARFIARPRTRLGVAFSDWRQLSVRDRLTFIRDHVLPPPSYIRDRYAVTSVPAIAWMYMHRILMAIAARPG
jgi:hypothetical protein